jgi:hypothetical protein
VQFEHERAPSPREVRLCGPTARVGDPVRVAMGGAEVEGWIAEVAQAILYVEIGKRPEGRLF